MVDLLLLMEKHVKSLIWIMITRVLFRSLTIFILVLITSVITRKRILLFMSMNNLFYLFKVLRRVNISGHWRAYWIMIDDANDGQMIFGDLGGLKLPDICLTGKEKSRKNLAQETCPDRGSNPVPLRDRRACCRLAHSGGLVMNKICYV